MQTQLLTTHEATRTVRRRDVSALVFRQNDSACATGKSVWVGVGTPSSGAVSIDATMRQRLGCIDSSGTPYSATLTIEATGTTMRTYINGTPLWQFANTYSYGHAGVYLSYHSSSGTPQGTPYHNVQHLRIERLSL